MLNKILRKNISPARIAGFVLSNFIGMAIVLTGLLFYTDAGSIWTDSDSFVSSDIIVINKKVTSANTVGTGNSSFSDTEIRDISSQPWARRVGEFQANDFSVVASVGTPAGRGMSTYMFFEAIPDEFIDVPRAQWNWRPGSDEIPIILPKDYLTLYNFGFASSAGLPQVSEGLMGSIPIRLRLTSDEGGRTRELHGHVAGFSNRLNTILVPKDFLEEANRELGSGTPKSPSRLVVDVSSPGDVAISDYLNSHDLEVAGDKTSSSAAFLLKVVTGAVLAIGTIITLLSLLVLLLSVSLIMERNRDKIHSLLMLGYDTGSVGRPYAILVVVSTLAAFALALGAAFGIRAYYLTPLTGLGAHASSVWPALGAGLVLTGLVLAANLVTVRRRVIGAFRA